jgi:hypothetical protein
MMGDEAQVDWSIMRGLLSRVWPVPIGLCRSKTADWSWDDLLDRLALARRRGQRAVAGTIPLPTPDPDKDLDSGRLVVAPLD